MTDVDGRPILMILSIAINDNEEPLHVCEGDDPKQLSLEFCQKHNLSDRFLDYIADQIETNAKIIMAKNDE